MLYVATIHFATPKWIAIQQRYMKKNIHEEFHVFAILNGISQEYHSEFYRVVAAGGAHEGKLNLLAGEICSQAAPDDVLLFLDGDAFPIRDPMPAIYEGLENTSMVAVRRDENGDPQPHPCFCAVRVRDWLRLNGDWSPGYMWQDTTGRFVTDVGGNLLRTLERTNSRWTPLLRSNARNDHPLFFGVYADIVYHQGAGFRSPESRVDNETRPWRMKGERLPFVGPQIIRFNADRRQRWTDELHRTSGQLSESWYAAIERDDEFYTKLLSPAKVSQAGD